jgi:hypothetical protein
MRVTALSQIFLWRNRIFIPIQSPDSIQYRHRQQSGPSSAAVSLMSHKDQGIALHRPALALKGSAQKPLVQLVNYSTQASDFRWISGPSVSP